VFFVVGTQDNLAISGTHTHGGPAGFLQYALFQITSFGFVQETFDAWVSGIANSIVDAHNNLQPAKVLINNGMLYGSNINRSPTSYLLNPQDEIDQYPEGDTDKNMMLLNILAEKTGKHMGVLNWFAGKHLPLSIFLSVCLSRIDL
jgi:neutral ceramidase